jgi:hypothetical protein
MAGKPIEKLKVLFLESCPLHYWVQRQWRSNGGPQTPLSSACLNFPTQSAHVAVSEYFYSHNEIAY